MDSSNRKPEVNKLNNEISRLSSENVQLRKIVGLIHENLELRFVLRDHEKVCSPPVEQPSSEKGCTPPAKESKNCNQQIADSLADEVCCSSYDKKSLSKSTANKRGLNMEGLGITSLSDRHRVKQVSMKGYESSGSSSDSLADPHTKEQRKFASSFPKLHEHERGSEESSVSNQIERRLAHYK